QTIIAMANPQQHPFVAGVDYHITGGVFGEWIWLKAWEVGDPEPLLPTLVVRDGTFGAADGTLLCVIAFFDPAAVSSPVQVDATSDDAPFPPLPPPPGGLPLLGVNAAQPTALPPQAQGARPAAGAPALDALFASLAGVEELPWLPGLPGRRRR